MIEVLNQLLNKTGDTLQTTENKLEDGVSFLLGSHLSDRCKLFDKLDHRNDQTAECDWSEGVSHASAERAKSRMTGHTLWSIITELHQCYRAG